MITANSNNDTPAFLYMHPCFSILTDDETGVAGVIKLFTLSLGALRNEGLCENGPSPNVQDGYGKTLENVRGMRM